MAPWNLGLRFLLEMAALVGVGSLGWAAADGLMSWVTAGASVGLAAALWGVFNVRDDPSRSGDAPVEVPGWIRLAVEALVFAAGAIGLTGLGGGAIGVIFGALVLIQYGTASARVRWLLESRGSVGETDRNES